MEDATIQRLGTKWRVFVYRGKLLVAWKPYPSLNAAMLQVQNLEKHHRPEDIEIVEVFERPPKPVKEKKHG